MDFAISFLICFIALLKISNSNILIITMNANRPQKLDNCYFKSLIKGNCEKRTKKIYLDYLYF